MATGALAGLEPGELPQRRLVEVALEAAAATAPALDAPRHDDDRRHGGSAEPDESFVVPAEDGSHGGADPKLIAEFLRFVRDGGLTETSPVAAREAVATGVLAAESLRDGSAPRVVPPVPGDLEAYFVRGQRR